MPYNYYSLEKSMEFTKAEQDKALATQWMWESSHQIKHTLLATLLTLFRV